MDTNSPQSAVDAFNAWVASWTTPEAAAARAKERAEYERRYEAMMARKRTERFNAEYEHLRAVLGR